MTETVPRFQDLTRFRNPPGARGRSALTVQLWWLVQDWLIRPTPQFMYGWRRFWWRLFGAMIGDGVLLRPTARTTYPWNVTIGEHSWIGDRVELYSLAPIRIGRHTVVSQDSYLCAGGHDYTKIGFDLNIAPVMIEDEVWIAAGCFIAPGVTVGHGAVIGARSLVLSDMPGAMICAGHPAKPIRPRPAAGS